MGNLFDVYINCLAVIEHFQQNGIQDDEEADRYGMAIETIADIRDMIHKMDVDEILDCVEEFGNGLLYGIPEVEMDEMTDTDFN